MVVDPARPALHRPWRLGSQTPNPNHIEPSTAGLVLEDFRQGRQGVGYRIELYRNGHIEALTLLDYCLERGRRIADSTERTAYWPSGEQRLQAASSRFLPYDDLAELTVSFQHVILAGWAQLALPFRDMVFTTAILNSERLTLLAPGDWGRDVLGRPVEGNVLIAESVVTRDDDAGQAIESAMKRLVNGFGLVLPALLDERGKFQRPTRLR